MQSVCFVPADLPVPVPHGSAVQEICAFQDGIFPILLFNAQHGFLQVFLFFLLFGIGKQVKLVNPFILYHPVCGKGDPPDGERGIDDPVKQRHSSRDNRTSQIGRIGVVSFKCSR